MIFPRVLNMRSVSSVDIMLVGLDSRELSLYCGRRYPQVEIWSDFFSGAVVGSTKGLKFFNYEGCMAKGEPFRGSRHMHILNITVFCQTR